MHMGIITKRINSSVIINDYMIKLIKFYELEISEVITQQIRSMHKLKYLSKLRNIGDYDLYYYTKYEINDYLTMKQLNKPTDTHRQRLTDNNIGCID